MSLFLRSIAKNAVFTVLGRDPTLSVKLSRIEEAGALTILNFHRISDNCLSAYEAMAPSLFNDLLGWLTGRFEIITFADLGRERSKRPQLILSFDDGYKDFIATAVPILDRYHLRANQNIIPAAVNTGLPPLNIILQDFIGQAPDSLLRETPLPGFDNPADQISSTTNRVRVGLRASAALKKLPISQQKKVMNGLSHSFERLDGWQTTQLMNLEEIRQIQDIHEIGVHSFEHASMAAETDEYVANDAMQCRTWFRSALGAAPRVYAFPNGSFRAGHTEIVQAAGFDHVLLVGENFSCRNASVHPRFTIHGHSSAELRFKAAGALVRPALREHQVERLSK